eukprot:Clim_evm7s85 gene=Clim_evmTU7s85
MVASDPHTHIVHDYPVGTRFPGFGSEHFPVPRVRDFAPVDKGFYGDVRVKYHLYGNASAEKKLVLIMGLGMRCEAWKRQIYYFMNKGDYDILAYDNRGCGESSVPSIFNTTKQMADDLSKLMEHLGWDQAHIVGISMGGMIAQEFAYWHTEKAISVSLLNTTAGMMTPSYWPGVSMLWDFFRAVMSTDPKQRATLAAQFLYSDVTRANTEFVTMLMKDQARVYYLGAASPAGRISHMMAGSRHWFTSSRAAMVRKSEVPILVMCGDSDSLIRPANSTWLHEHLGGELLIIADGGHGVIGEHERIVNEKLEEHLEQSHKVWKTVKRTTPYLNASRL